MPKLTIIDNFLDDEEFLRILKSVEGVELPWHRQTSIGDGTGDFSTASQHDNENLIDTNKDFQFIHIVHDGVSIVSDHANLVGNLMQKLSPIAISRIKINCTMPASEFCQTGWHTDMDENIGGITSILYLNTCNGYTLFRDGTKCYSEANRLVSFDSNLEHTGVPHTDNTPCRFLINMNYFPNTGVNNEQDND